MVLNESIVEDASLTWFAELGYTCLSADALTRPLPWGEVTCHGSRTSAHGDLVAGPGIPNDERAVVAESATVRTGSELKP